MYKIFHVRTETILHKTAVKLEMPETICEQKWREQAGETH